MKRFLRAVALVAIALAAIVSTGTAYPYLRTVPLQYRVTGTGYRGSLGVGTLSYADTLVRHSASGQRFDTLYVHLSDFYGGGHDVSATQALATDSTMLFTVWAVPLASSPTAVVGDSAYMTLAGCLSGGPQGSTAQFASATADWVSAPLIALLGCGSNAAVFANTWNTNWIDPPATATNITMGQYQDYRLIISGDYTGSYQYFIQYWAESTAPIHDVQ